MSRFLWFTVYMLITHVLQLSCYAERNSSLNCDLPVRQILIQLMTACAGVILQQKVYKTRYTHHWHGLTDTATENDVRPAGSCRHCARHSSVCRPLLRLVKAAGGYHHNLYSPITRGRWIQNKKCTKKEKKKHTHTTVQQCLLIASMLQ